MNTIQLFINGTPTPQPEGVTLPELIERLNLPAAMLLIEHNGQALHRNEWADRPLADGDRLELLQVAAGG